jgi:hypothetical protein
MRFLTTLLTATALCASMLAIAAHKAGELPEPELWTVSTATWDMNTSVEAAADDGPSIDRAALGKLSGEASRPGPDLGFPDGHQG